MMITHRLLLLPLAVLGVLAATTERVDLVADLDLDTPIAAIDDAGPHQQPWLSARGSRQLLQNSK